MLGFIWVLREYERGVVFRLGRLNPEPKGPRPWARWVPHIVVEIVSEGGEERDYVEKREEYLLIGVSEYWILDPIKRQLLVLQRAGDIWEEVVVLPGMVYQTHILPGLEVRPEELPGPAEDA